MMDLLTLSFALGTGKSCACHTILASKGNELERLDIDPLNESFSRLADEKKEHLDLNKAGCRMSLGPLISLFVLLPFDMKTDAAPFPQSALQLQIGTALRNAGINGTTEDIMGKCIRRTLVLQI